MGIIILGKEMKNSNPASQQVCIEVCRVSSKDVQPCNYWATLAERLYYHIEKFSES